MAGDKVILVVALSARAIAAACRRAGFDVIAVDFFADEDTAAFAQALVRYPGSYGCGFTAKRLFPIIDEAIARAGVEPDFLLLGSGFEDRPKLVDRLGSRWRLLGASGSAIAAVKRPERLQGGCALLKVPRPAIARMVPKDGDWLVKRIGASGGYHVLPAEPGPVAPHHFAEEKVDGRGWSFSALMIGDCFVPIGFCRQFVEPVDGQPFRFSGIAGPVLPPAPFDREITEAAERLCRHFGLAGWIGFDVMIGENRWHLLEINPRPTAAIDVLDDDQVPVMATWLAATNDRQITRFLPNATIRATKVIYSSSQSMTVPAIDWPTGICDRPVPGQTIGWGEPVATVIASGASVEDARRQADRLGHIILDLLGSGSDGA